MNDEQKGHIERILLGKIWALTYVQDGKAATYLSAQGIEGLQGVVALCMSALEQYRRTLSLKQRDAILALLESLGAPAPSWTQGP